MNWNLEGLYVHGMYLDLFSVGGYVEQSRVAYGGNIKHTVVLTKPIEVFGAMRDRVILDHKDVQGVKSHA